MARKLYDAYSITKAIHRAMQMQKDSCSAWDQFVPAGSNWTAPKLTKTAYNSSNKGSNVAKQTTESPPEPEIEDWSLARTIAFICNFLWQCEWAYATAEEDVGCIYKVMKVKFIQTQHNPLLKSN